MAAGSSEPAEPPNPVRRMPVDPPAQQDGPANPLPAISPPQTQSGVQLNQQFNVSVQQIPPTAWDKLSPEQIIHVTKMIVQQADETDKRHFQYAMDVAKRDDDGKKRALVIGGAVSVAAYLAAAWLGMAGHEVVAITIALPLATVLAIVVGNRFLG